MSENFQNINIRIIGIFLILMMVCVVSVSAETYTYAAKWGMSGTANGQGQPTDVAIDSAGNIYVPDMQNSRIQKFTSDGTFVTKWGSFGTLDGQFKQPWGIAVDSTGNVYVTDYWNHRVQKFTSDGAFITKWGSSGAGDGQFAVSTPMGGLAVDNAGNVYVADQNNNRIQKFTSNGVFLAKWGTAGSGDGQFRQPQDVATDNAGNVYVTDKGNNRIQKFTSDGTFITKWGSAGGSDGQFTTPWGITADGAGNVFVVEQSGFYMGGYPGPFVGFRVQKFDPTGVFITKFGGGSPQQNMMDGFLNGPRNAAVDGEGNVFVADTGYNRIQKFMLVIPLNAAFSANSTSGDAPLAVKFTDASTGRITAWSWTFGDSSASNEKSPVHTYMDAGIYPVVLTVTDNTGATATATETITVTATAVPEFPSSVLPVTMIIGVLGAVLFIRITREH